MFHRRGVERRHRVPSEPNRGAIPSLPFGGVQGVIGSVENGTTVVMRQGFCDARAEGVRQHEGPVPELSRRKPLPNSLNDAHGVVEPDVRQKHQDLLPTGPAEIILRPQPLAADTGEMLENGVTGIVPVRVVDGLELIDVDDGDTQAGAAALLAANASSSSSRPSTTRTGLAQGSLVLLQGRDVGSDGQHPAVGQDRVVHPEPPPVDEIGLERLSRHAPPPRQSSGDEGVNVIVDPHPELVLGREPEDVSERQRAVVVPHEQVSVHFVGIPKPLLAVVEGDRLSAFREGLRKAVKGFIVEV